MVGVFVVLFLYGVFGFLFWDLRGVWWVVGFGFFCV